MLELLAGTKLEILTACSGDNLQTIMFDDSVIGIVPTSGIVYEMPVVQWCDTCDMEAAPHWNDKSCDCSEEKCETEGYESGCKCEWVYPCHSFHCDSCRTWHENDSSHLCSNCETCSDCCECSWCNGCEEPISHNGMCNKCDACQSCCKGYSCNDCGTKIDMDYDCYCCECDCCESCCNCHDGIACEWESECVLPTHSEWSATNAIAIIDASSVDPVMSMADFYLSEFLSVLAPSAAKEALAFQSGIIRTCDDAFRSYVLCAIGGEIRHHSSVKNILPDGRHSAFDYFYAMGQNNDRVKLMRDCSEMFGDGSWDGGYGGRPWQIAADILMARESGKLDAKIFVDRIFSCQHNNGSLLNKVSWGGDHDTSEMETIGDAHHSTDVQTLLEYASDEMVEMMASGFASMRAAILDWNRNVRVGGEPMRKVSQEMLKASSLVRAAMIERSLMVGI